MFRCVMSYELDERTNALKSGEQLVATYYKRKRGSTPPYIIVGNGYSTKAFPPEVVMDAFEVFSELSTAQQKLFIWLKDILVSQNLNNHYAKRRVENPNLVRLDRGKDNEDHLRIKTMMGENRNGSVLKEKGVLEKVERGVYMLNPYLFIPSSDFADVAKLWEDLTN